MKNKNCLVKFNCVSLHINGESGVLFVRWINLRSGKLNKYFFGENRTEKGTSDQVNLFGKMIFIWHNNEGESRKKRWKK